MAASTSIPETLDLLELDEGRCPALTAHAGGTLREAASVCLESRHHASGVNIAVDGDESRSYSLTWPGVTDQMKRTHNDLQDATRDGACGVAILVTKRITGLTVVEKSRKGTGFDYWLGEDDDLFQNKARLEVSGIIDAKGKVQPINARVKRKQKQTTRSDALKVAAYVVIVEFAKPIVHYSVRVA